MLPLFTVSDAQDEGALSTAPSTALSTTLRTKRSTALSTALTSALTSALSTASLHSDNTLITHLSPKSPMLEYTWNLGESDLFKLLRWKARERTNARLQESGKEEAET